jgi:isopenicillin N synthase-like dioxygenase
MSNTVTETASAEPQYEFFYRDGGWDNRREILRGDRAVQTFEEIPVVDVGGIFSPDKGERMRVADEIAEICKTVGFMYIKNHGIPQQLTDDLFDLSRKYHARPVEAKMKQYVYHNQQLRGYDVHYTDGDNGRQGEEGFPVGRELSWSPCSHPPTTNKDIFCKYSQERIISI